MATKPPSEPARKFSLLNDDGTRVTKEGVEALARWMPQMRGYFSNEGREHATWPANNHPLSVFDAFSRRPPEAVGIAGQLAKDLVGFEQTGELLGRKPFAWQIGATQWLVFSLLNGGSSYLIEGGPGVGKTLVMGEVLRAAIASGMFHARNKILVVFNKPHIAVQQLFDQQERSHRFVRTNTDGASGIDINYSNGNTQFLPLPSAHATRRAINGLSGDITRGIPAAMLQGNAVVTGIRTFTARGNEDAIKQLDAESENDATVVIVTQQMIRSSDLMKRILAETGLVIVDDARKGANVFQQYCTDERQTLSTDENVRPPLVVMASALSETNGTESRPMADAYSPKLTMFGAMELDALGRRVSPDIGIDVSPRESSESLYPSLSHETIKRFVTMHFDDVATERTLGIPHSYEQDTCIVVDKPAIPFVADAIRLEYERRAIPATVVPFAFDGIKYEIAQSNRQKILGWAATPYARDEKKRFGPKVIVFPAREFVDALSLPFPNVIIDGHLLSDATMARRIGRLGHLSGEGHPKNFRATMRVVLTAETVNTPFSFLSTDPERRTFAPLGILRGSAGAKNDAQALKKARWYPIPTTESLREWPREPGTPIVETPVVTDEEREKTRKDLAGALQKLKINAAAFDSRQWRKNTRMRSNFSEKIIATLWPFAKTIFGYDDDDDWMSVVVTQTQRAWNDPMYIVDIVERIFERAQPIQAPTILTNDDPDSPAEVDAETTGEESDDGELDAATVLDAFDNDEYGDEELDDYSNCDDE